MVVKPTPIAMADHYLNEALEIPSFCPILSPIRLIRIFQGELHRGCKPTGTASIMLDQVQVPAKYRVGEEGRSFIIFAAAGADYLRICLSMQVVAAAEASLEETKAYALQRTALVIL